MGLLEQFLLPFGITQVKNRATHRGWLNAPQESAHCCTPRPCCTLALKAHTQKNGGYVDRSRRHSGQCA